MINLIKPISNLIQKDERDSLEQSELLEHYYNEATPSEQKIIDTIMMCICGYSLDTIINKPHQIKSRDM